MSDASEIRTFSWLSLGAKLLAWLGYAFLVIPSLIVIPLSFGDSQILVFPPPNLSMAHYREYFVEGNWLDATWQSLRVALGVTFFSLVIGVGAAYGLQRSEFRGKKLVTLILLSPIFVPGVVVGLALYIYLSRLGIAGTTFGLMIGHTIVVVPFVIVTANAGLRQIDSGLETAASLMGAGKLYVLRRVTLPLLLPSVLAAGLFAFLMSFDEVVISYFIASVRQTTLPVKMYSSIKWEITPVIAAISSMLTVFALMICVVTALLQRKN
ncbi:ABC transporter permease [Bosea sp. (in: a-proteobacteria)]|uniref:ABC transporter permease n=1 Tax=Bosea sp. (in: a-proteobacteria) TaxID=1871050 RepID=UPI002624E95C|nr:ABC transporter permease [Bosea sp. (in: a-proteobacteria)]MCO5089485.1 ABC transporter permease [Bosea sp. (in: a-proteobacteria)]